MVDRNKLEKVEMALTAIRVEVLRAMNKFPAFNSAHEGYAVLKEEVDEAWDEIKRNESVMAKEEMIQVGAMAVRFLVDV